MTTLKVHDPNKKSFDEVEDLGVALRKVNDSGQLHVGLLHKPDDKSAQILHLQTHLDLKNEVPTNDYRWIQVDLDDLNRRAIVGLCEAIASTQAKIPYGFAFNGTYFSATGNFLEHGLGKGLTCATFIMAVFRTLHFEILKVSEWQSRDGDVEWQTEMVGYLRRKHGELLAGIVASHIGDPRFRPEEAAAGAVSADRPLSFDDASRLGARIRSTLAKTYK